MRQMSKKRRVFLTVCVVALAVVTGIFGGVSAQESGGNKGGGLDVTIHSDKSMSGQEQIAWVESKTESARGIANQVQNMLDQARKEKDTLKITCLNDKLTQIHVNLRGIEERTEALKTAVRANDTTTANQQFAILRIYISKIEGLRAEAENCLGEVDVVLGETETIVTVDEDVTPDDPSEDVPIVDDIGVEPSPHASGYY